MTIPSTPEVIPPAQADSRRRQALYGQLLLFVLIRIVNNTSMRMIYPYLGIFAQGVGTNLTRLSLAMSLRSGLGTVAPLLASVADSRGRKAGMLFGSGLFLLGLLGVILWPGYLTFVLALILPLVGALVFIPSMQAYLGDRVAYAERGRLIAFTEFGWSLSFIFGVPLMGVLIRRFGWQAPFPVLAGLGLVGLLALWRIIPPDAAPPAGQPGLLRNLTSVLSHPTALIAIGMGMAFASANEMVNLVFGVWMRDAFGVEIGALAIASAVLGVSELAGEGVSSALTDRLGKKRAVGAGLLLNCLALLALLKLGVSFAGALAGLFLFYLTFEFTIVSSLPLITEVLPQQRATMMSTYIACLSLGRAGGALLSPHLYGLGSGILFVALGAIGLNLVSLAALGFLKTGEEYPLAEAQRRSASPAGREEERG